MAGAVKIVVVGGVAAGPKTAARARRCDPRAEITILEKGEHISYSACVSCALTRKRYKRKELAEFAAQTR